MGCRDLKSKIIEHCTDIFQQKLLIINNELKHLSEAIAEDTKSSAGDKYETGREMANLEKEKFHAQALGFKNSLASLKALPERISTKIDLGSLIQTNKEWIHLSISLGQLEVDGESVLVISPMAPLAQLMMGKVKGETVTFRENDYQIIGIC
jgi:transcription elongation GreA/GreB family factor